MRRESWTNALILLMASLVGVAAFAYPFFSPMVASGPTATAHAQDAPLVTLVLTLLCVIIVVANLTSRQMSARTVAVLGVLSAVNAVLRAIPGPAGFSAIFFLLALCGYVYGGTFGFLMGVLSLLVSALIGGGVGPWLPYQMLSTGWIGLTSGWLPNLRRWPRAERVLLATWVALWGFAFGAIMNLWFWPYVSAMQASPGQNWEPGLRLYEGLRRYGAFYATTSLWWDLTRAAGNAALVIFLGGPLIKVLRRFKHVLGFETAPSVAAPCLDNCDGPQHNIAHDAQTTEGG
jgi:energy-coupling factor transport system substrate-specific component